MATENETFTYQPTTSGTYTWSFLMKNSGTVAQPASVCYLDNLQVSYPYPYTRIECDKAPNASYRFGFNGKEKESYLYGDGDAYDFGARIYDGRIGKLLSIDPLSIKFPSESDYSYAGNSPILMVDHEGKNKTVYLTVINVDGSNEYLKLEDKKDVRIKVKNVSDGQGGAIASIQTYDVTQSVTLDMKNMTFNVGEEKLIGNDMGLLSAVGQVIDNFVQNGGKGGAQRHGYRLVSKSGKNVGPESIKFEIPKEGMKGLETIDFDEFKTIMEIRDAALKEKGLETLIEFIKNLTDAKTELDDAKSESDKKK